MAERAFMSHSDLVPLSGMIKNDAQACQMANEKINKNENRYDIISKEFLTSIKLKMVKNTEKLSKLETAIVRKEKPRMLKNLEIVEAMYKEALFLKVFPLKDPLDGIEVDLRIARIINSVSKTP